MVQQELWLWGCWPDQWHQSHQWRLYMALLSWLLGIMCVPEEIQHPQASHQTRCQPCTMPMQCCLEDIVCNKLRQYLYYLILPHWAFCKPYVYCWLGISCCIHGLPIYSQHFPRLDVMDLTDCIFYSMLNAPSPSHVIMLRKIKLAEELHLLYVYTTWIAASLNIRTGAVLGTQS